MSQPPSRHSAARRNAEALLSKAQKREQSFKLEQERESEAVALKTARDSASCVSPRRRKTRS